MVWGGESSNTTPHPFSGPPRQFVFAPPMVVVPYKLPAASATRLATGSAPSFPPVKLWRVCSFGPAASAQTDSKVSAIKVAHRDLDTFFMAGTWRKPRIIIALSRENGH